MGFRCRFHNLFEEFCSIFIEPNVQIVYEPGCWGPVTCAGPRVCGRLAAAPHAAGAVQVTLPWLRSQHCSTQMAGNKGLRGPPRFSGVSCPLHSPRGCAPSPALRACSPGSPASLSDWQRATLTTPRVWSGWKGGHCMSLSALITLCLHPPLQMSGKWSPSRCQQILPTERLL